MAKGYKKAAATYLCFQNDLRQLASMYREMMILSFHNGTEIPEHLCKSYLILGPLDKVAGFLALPGHWGDILKTKYKRKDKAVEALLMACRTPTVAAFRSKLGTSARGGADISFKPTKGSYGTLTDL